MKVLFDFRPVRSPISGVARYCIDLVNSLQCDNKHDVYLYGQNFMQRNKDLNIIRPEIRNLNESFLFPRKVENIFLESGFRADILRNSIQVDITHETYFARLDMPNSKKVSTIHDIIPITHPHLFSKRAVLFSKRNFKRQALHSDAIIAPSEHTKNLILSYYPSISDRVKVVPLGVSPTLIDYSTSLSAKKNCETNKPYFVIVGNIEPRKNIPTLAKALKDMNDRINSEFELVVIGRNNNKANEIQKKCFDLLQNRIHFTGFIGEREKFNLISNSLGLIFPSIYEGFGIPAIEAMSLSIPTLLANNSSLKELAVDPWQLFDTFNVDELSLKLEDIVYKRFPGLLIERCLDSSKKYTWLESGSQTNEIYSDLA